MRSPNPFRALEDIQPSQPQMQPYRSQRNERRLPVSVRVTVFGFDAFGRVFHELTVTQNVSRHGCVFRLYTEPLEATPLVLRVLGRDACLAGDAPGLPYRVVWKRPAAVGWEVGALAEGDTDLLQVAFPASEP